MARLLARLGDPHLAAPAVHVAGTKGKGSTTRLAARLLAARGLRVGEYLSPHVDHVRERVAIGGEPLDEASFARLLGEADRAARDEALATGDPPTWFELVTAVAFGAFREREAGAVALEVGLGGRLDATNLPDLPALAAGVAPVSLDHQETLGGTLEAIAGEKAGILRPGAAAVFGPQPPEAARALDRHARRLGVEPRRVGPDYEARPCRPPPPDRPEAPQWLRVRTPGGPWPGEVPLAWPGRHQADNAALALGLADAFWAALGRPPATPGEAARAWGLAPPLPGRLDVLARRPWVVADGAHNEASAAALAHTVGERFSARRRILVFASAADKDWRAVLRRLAPLAEAVFLTSFPSPRCQDGTAVAEWLIREWPGVRTETVPSPAEALARARAALPPDGLALVAGSFMLAGEARRIVHG